MTWTNTGGGNHAGTDWTIADGTTVAGVHYNIGTVTIASGDTATIEQGTELEVYAESVYIEGTINGKGKGYSGGVSTGASGQGPGGGSGTSSDGGDAGGGAYGGNGGSGDVSGGTAYGDSNLCHIQMGSGGGDGDGKDGGDGGGSVILVGNIVDMENSTIDCDGTRGSNGANAGGGGGAGGGILIVGNTVNLDNATLTADGGDGGNETTGTPGAGGAGGGGGGGRIKVFYFTSLSESGTTKSALGSTYANNGGNGSTNSDTIGECNATYDVGQTFTTQAGLPSAVKNIKAYISTVTAVDVGIEVTVWDSTSKNTNYGSALLETITTPGEYTWTFSDYIVLDENTQYYIEFVSDGTTDVVFGLNGYSSEMGGSFYSSLYEVQSYDMYLSVEGLSHITDIEVYNTSYKNIKAKITNTMLSGAVHTINPNGSGSISYTDDFTNEKYLVDGVYSDVTYTSEKLSIADDGYIYYKIDTKYAIVGVPILTSLINVTSGTPTIQIAYDSGGSPDTFYNIDTGISDNILTEYELISGDDVVLAGKTVFYVRIDCAGGGNVTCDIESIQFDIDIVTIDAQNPIVETGTTPATYQCDQGDGSSVNCTVELKYRDRKWA